ncbi:MAG TPA: hypothetical protein VN879_11475 [Candidatus Acidoferrales bacterium]|nr:hypothetical protein [Candidatus Acidoferrales bacterium]
MVSAVLYPFQDPFRSVKTHLRQFGWQLPVLDTIQNYSEVHNLLRAYRAGSIRV